MNFTGGIDASFISSVGGIATTLIDNLKIPATLVSGLFLAFWIIKKIVGWFSELSRVARIKFLASSLGMSSEDTQAEVMKYRRARFRKELLHLEQEEADEVDDIEE